MSEATTLEYSSVDAEIAAAARVPVVPPADPLRAIDDERRQARNKLEELAVKIADNEPVDPHELRDLMRDADVDRSFIDTLVKRRRDRRSAVAWIQQAEEDKAKAAEIDRKAKHARQEFETLKAELERRIQTELPPLQAKWAQLQAEAAKASGEASWLKSRGYATLRETAPPHIQARIDELQEESRRINQQINDSADHSKEENELLRDAAFWRRHIERMDKLGVVVRPQMPSGLSHKNYQRWQWFFSPVPLPHIPDIAAKRKQLVADLEYQARQLSEHDKRHFGPLYQRNREISAEIARLEQSKLVP